MSARRRPDNRPAAVLFESTPERLIAALRLAAAPFGFLALWLDPVGPGPSALIVDIVLYTFLTYALALAIMMRFVLPDLATQLVIHFVDLAMIAALMHFADGPTGAHLVLFVVALSFGALRWSWAGVAATGLVLATLFVAVDAATDPEGQLDGLLARGAYLVAAGVVVAYLTVILHRMRVRLAGLAAWPAEPVGGAGHPPLERTLAHALSVTGGRCIVALWEEGEEPQLNVARFDASGFRLAQQPPSSVGVVAPELAGAPFLLADARAGLVQTTSGRLAEHPRPIDPALMSDLSIRTAAVAPMKAPHAAGHLLLIEASGGASDVVLMAEAVASHVAAQIEHHVMHRKGAAAAARHERMQLARDLHDGTIQAMTAVALRLRAMVPNAPAELKPRIAELQELVAEEQRALRDYLSIPRNRLPWELPLMPQIAYTLREIEGLWGCSGAYEVSPPDAKVTLAMGDQLNLLIKEAAANAMRHGGADRIHVAVALEGEKLRLVVKDNGRGLGFDECEAGELSERQEGPHSLSARVREQGGTLRSASNEEGVELKIELPLGGGTGAPDSA